MRGRKPKPTSLRLLEGNREHRTIHVDLEPQPEKMAPDCPAHLSKDAKKEWKYIVKSLDGLGLLTMVDKAVLAGYCQSFAAWAECETFIRDNGNVIVVRNDKGEVRAVHAAPQAVLALRHLEKIRQFAAELGLSPSARTRVKLEKPADQSRRGKLLA